MLLFVVLFIKCFPIYLFCVVLFDCLLCMIDLFGVWRFINCLRVVSFCLGLLGGFGARVRFDVVCCMLCGLLI